MYKGLKFGKEYMNKGDSQLWFNLNSISEKRWIRFFKVKNKNIFTINFT